MDRHVASATIPHLHHLRFNLTKSRRQHPAGIFRNQDSGGSHDGIDDVAGAQSELLDTPVDAGPDRRLVEIDLSLCQRGFCARLLCRKQSRDANHCGLPGSHGCVKRALAATQQNVELLDVTLRHHAGVALLQFPLSVEFVGDLLIRSLGFLGLPFGFQNVGLRSQHRGVDLRNLASGCLHRGLLLGVV